MRPSRLAALVAASMIAIAPQIARAGPYYTAYRPAGNPASKDSHRSLLRSIRNSAAKLCGSRNCVIDDGDCEYYWVALHRACVHHDSGNDSTLIN